ncbi:MAG: hypothetical protein OXI56_13020 [bacterium]|nr:hypothetical protein [bacterium]MDE0602710.1 hypothetical protein [bacterium]
MNPEAERGSAPIEVVLGIGLILIPIALLSLSFGAYLQRMVFVRIAAVEAGRELVLSDGSEEGVVALIAEIARNHGLQVSDVGVGFCGRAIRPVTERPGSGCGSPVKGREFTVTVTVGIPALVTPYGEVGNLTTRASHTETVGLYRSTR